MVLADDKENVKLKQKSWRLLKFKAGQNLGDHEFWLSSKFIVRWSAWSSQPSLENIWITDIVHLCDKHGYNFFKSDSSMSNDLK